MEIALALSVCSCKECFTCYRPIKVRVSHYRLIAAVG